MKPELGKAVTRAPKAASFQPKPPARLARTAPATMIKPQGNQTAATAGSNRRATGVAAPNRNNMQGKAKYSTKALRPPIASRGSNRVRAAK